MGLGRPQHHVQDTYTSYIIRENRIGSFGVMILCAIVFIIGFYSILIGDVSFGFKLMLGSGIVFFISYSIFKHNR